MTSRDPLPFILTAGSLSLLSGASGVGKTAFIALLAKLFHEGSDIMGHGLSRTSVGYITGDRSWHDSKQWFEKIGFPEIAQYSLVDDRSFDLLKIGKRASGPDALIDCIDRLEMSEPGIIFVDPIALFMGGNLLDYHAVALSCIAMQRYAMDEGHCLVGICHTSKQKADKNERYLRMQDRINGTGALLGFTSTQMNLAGPDETGDKRGYLQCYVNPHQAKAETWFLKRSNEDGLLSFVPVEPVEGAKEPAVLTEELLDVHRLLNEPPEPTATAEILLRSTHLKITPKTIFRRLSILAELSLVSQPSRGFWLKHLYRGTLPLASAEAGAKVH